MTGTKFITRNQHPNSKKNRASSMPATFSNFTPVSGVIMIFARPWLPNPAEKKNSSSVQDLDVQKTPIVDLGKMLTIPRCNFFWDRNPKAPFQPPKRSPSPQVKLFVSPFFGLLQICFSRADVQGFMTSAEKMEMPLANKYGKAGHGLHLNTAGHVLWQTDGCWWIWVVRCLGWLVVKWLGADCWENA